MKNKNVIFSNEILMLYNMTSYLKYVIHRPQFENLYWQFVKNKNKIHTIHTIQTYNP